MSVSIDDVREYWDQRPCNVRHSDKPVGTAEYFAEVERRKYTVEPHIPGFAQFDRWRDKRVLEIGCGIGTDAARFVRAGALYHGIDLSPTSVGITSQRLRLERSINAWRTTVCDAQRLDAAVHWDLYHLVYSFGVLHHTPEPRHVIERVHGLMNDESELRIMLYAKHSWKAAMIRAQVDQPEAQDHCPLARTYDHGEIRALLHPWFEVTSMTQAHVFPFNVERYVRGELVKEPWFECMPLNVYDALCTSLGWHTLVVARRI